MDQEQTEEAGRGVWLQAPCLTSSKNRHHVSHGTWNQTVAALNSKCDGLPSKGDIIVIVGSANPVRDGDASRMNRNHSAHVRAILE